MKLSFEQTRWYTGFVKYVGHNPDGKPRCFYLGRDQSAAEVTVMRLTLAWKQLRADNQPGWTDAAVQTALGQPSAVAGAPPVAIPERIGLPAPLAEPQVVQSGLTLHDAMDEYLEYEEQRAPHQVSYAHLQGVRIRIKRIKAAMPDRPLAEVDADSILRLVAHFASRPIKQKSGRPLGSMLLRGRLESWPRT